ncbi:DUF1365 domain-containing protein [Lolliginicoccus suaedae]|uniref:DUF1365 domain-containing protein n=1 Tax=Lolliginicoccus suaedae TaxID=2605429 RepID=UPI0011F08C38|nr:DUF1365 domain-containing protein [Lolliginicoccus suaedae]
MTSATVRAYPGALYPTEVRHVRRAPLHNEFTYRSYWWLVDLDRLPVLPWWLRPLARFEARDHLGDPARSIRENVDAFLATRGIDLRGGTILMLANARVLGVNFNPLSVFWCFGADGGLRCVIAEVRNTYGERHCYLLPVDAATEPGGARVAKEFYVSPFNDVSGDYELRLPVPGEKLGLAIVLHRSAQPPFVASVTGTRRPITRRTLLRAFVSIPWAPLRVIVQIRWQGIRLWARRLPIQPRPAHARQEGT